MDDCWLDLLKGKFFPGKMRLNTHRLLGAPGQPGQAKVKIAACGHSYAYNHTKKTAEKQPDPGNLSCNPLPAKLC